MRTSQRGPSSSSTRSNRSRLAIATRLGFVEPLEGRVLLTAVVVNSVLDLPSPPAGMVTLRAAIATANASTTPTTITFDPTLFASGLTIGLNGTVLSLTNTSQPTTITGPAAGVTISGVDTSQVFHLDSGATALLNGITVTHGIGSAIGNAGILTLVGVTVSNSTGNNGGGINNAGTLTLTNDTIAGNSSTTYSGKGGGGIYNSGTAILTNVTICGNTAANWAGYYNTGQGGGIWNAATAANFVLTNTLIAGNSTDNAGPDVFGGFNSLGHNLIGKTDDSSGWIIDDRTGTVATPLDPKLGALANNGGKTWTMLPLSGSPAIDHGINVLIPSGITTDQRGLARVAYGTVDIGAVEVQDVTVTITATGPAGQSATATQSKSFALGSFTQSNATAPFTVTVNWGDGPGNTTLSNVSPGTIRATAHTFATSGNKTVTITVKDSAGHTSKTSPTFTVTVAPVATTASISGTIFNDANGNGLRDNGEVGIAGITLYNDANNNSVKDSGEATAATDSSGNYRFGGLSAGNYKIREIVPAGWKQTTPANNYGWTIVALGASQNYTGANFGQQIAATASIAGRVFNDANSNGLRDVGELGLGLWKVYIDTNNNGLLDGGEASYLTDAFGNFTFTGLAAGTYIVRVQQFSGTAATKPTGGVLTIKLTAGQVSTGTLFGEKSIA